MVPAVTNLNVVSGDQTELKSDLLAGRRVLLVGAGMLNDWLGALVEHVEDPAVFDDDSAAEVVSAFAERSGGLEAAVIDAASVFGAGGTEGMAASLDASWTFARAAATAGMIERGGGTIVFVAPESAAGDRSAIAVADGLENAARALSVEWARFDIRVVAICPRAGALRSDIADLVVWLCSASGTYAAGCRISPGS